MNFFHTRTIYQWQHATSVSAFFSSLLILNLCGWYMVGSTKSIIEKVNAMAPALTNVKWEPFRQDAILEFADGPQHTWLRLAGIHLFATRQSPDEMGIMSLPEGRDVEYFDVFDDSPFLQKFLGAETFGPSEVVIYDMHGRAVEDSGFTKPLHVVVGCSDGILDVICEKLELMEKGDKSNY